MTFELRPRGSRYFIIGSIALDNCDIGGKLLELRRELLWEGFGQPEFHATNDKVWVRDRVFNFLAKSNFRADVIIIDKPKIEDYLRADRLRSYQRAWFLHFEHLATKVVTARDELLVVTASLQVNRMKHAVREAVREVVTQLFPTGSLHTAFWPAMSDPCLQIADYVVWAVQRKHEQGDSGFYDRISSRTVDEHQPFRHVQQKFY